MIPWGWLFLGALFVGSFYVLLKIYAYVAAAFVLAYMLEPLVTKLEKRKVPRALGDVMVLLGFFIVLAGFFWIAVPLLAEQARDLAEKSPKILATGREFLERYLSGTTAKRMLEVFPQLDNVVKSISAPQAAIQAPSPGLAVAEPLTSLFGSLARSVVSFITGVLGLLVIPLLAFYLLRDFPKLGDRLLRIVPRNKQKTIQILRSRLDLVLGGFLRGQMLVSCTLATYYTAAFLALRIELAFVLGVLAGVLNLVPYVGIMTVIVTTFLVTVLHGASVAVLIALAIVFLIGMALEGVLLTPRIVGDRVGLSPLSILIALMIGGELFGFVGMLLAIPTAATAKVFLEYWIETRV